MKESNLTLPIRGKVDSGLLFPPLIRLSLEDWAWPCGDQTCNGDTISLGGVSLGNIGDRVWRAFMMLAMYSPYASVAFT